jgi:hypothetical protein
MCIHACCIPVSIVTRSTISTWSTSAVHPGHVRIQYVSPVGHVQRRQGTLEIDTSGSLQMRISCYCDRSSQGRSWLTSFPARLKQATMAVVLWARAGNPNTWSDDGSRFLTAAVANSFGSHSLGLAAISFMTSSAFLPSLPASSLTASTIIFKAPFMLCSLNLHVCDHD